MPSVTERHVRPETRRLGLLAAVTFAAGLVTPASAPLPGERVVAAGGTAAAVPAPGRTVDGYDISWPNCPKGQGIPQRRTLGLPMPPRGAAMVVIGLTNGPGFTSNPCLAGQVRWARQNRTLTGAYAVASFPRPAELARYGGTGPWPAGDLESRLRNAGHAQARFNLASADRAGLPVPYVWIDVENVRQWPWSERTRENRALLAGVVQGYRSAGVRVGFYSYAGAWRAITGGWRTVEPAWVTGATTRAEAVRRCRRPSFSGGPVLLSQWYRRGGNVDHNVTCPGNAPAAGRQEIFVRF